MILTEDFINQHSSNGALTNAQFAVLGIEPARGWKKLVVGKNVDDQTAQRFIQARNITARKHRRHLREQERGQRTLTECKPVQPPVKVTTPIPQSHQREVARNPGEVICPIRPYKGTPIKDLPTSFLHWCVKTDIYHKEFLSDVCQFLNPQSPPKPSKHEQIESNGKSIDTKVYDCSHMFDPNSDWPGRQEWDGVTAPWWDQSQPLDDEYRGMFQ